MRKIELVYNYMLEQRLEKNRKAMTQAEIAAALGISLSIVNAAIGHLRKMNAVRVKLRSFDVVDAKKILYYWASIRNVEKDVIYSTRADAPVSEIEKSMPPSIVYAAYSAYKFRFKDVPADYSEVYVYLADEKDIQKITKRFPPSKNKPNFFVLRDGTGKMTLANVFVDLWNMKEWYAKEFLIALERKINEVI
ncbi:MAG: winged helix-turn-helix domain-containing protein [Candidatus Aenigmarchaeota archaeon]|nr:winged helix-turn-helix domain-containing protein [Candidatus Aenigmarchaeota archaeon]